MAALWSRSGRAPHSYLGGTVTVGEIKMLSYVRVQDYMDGGFVPLTPIMA